MKRQKLPAILMLSAAAITALIVYFKGYGLKVMLIALLAVLVIFYIIGSAIKMVLDSFEKRNSERVSDEGEVIEKRETEDEDEPEDFETEDADNKF